MSTAPTKYQPDSTTHTTLRPIGIMEDFDVNIRGGELHEALFLRTQVLGWLQPLMPYDQGDDVLHLIAVHHGKVVGVISCGEQAPPLAVTVGSRRTDEVKYLRFWGVAVEPSWHGKGLGRALMGALRREALTQQSNTLWATARLDALPFYRQLGFTIVGNPTVAPGSGLASRYIILCL